MEFLVSEIQADKRLDQLLVDEGIFLSRSQAKSAIENSEVLVNNAPKNAHYKVRVSDCITYEKTTNKQPTLAAENIPLDVVFEDDDILVINKPAGLVVHPGNGHYDGTLVNALLYHEKQLANADDQTRPGLVHRIDKDTSGLLCIAKTDLAFQSLTKQLADHSMHREYYALVNGVIYEDDGKIIAPLARDMNSPTKYCVNINKGKEAITYFHVEKRFAEAHCTLLSCRLLTGRTHQIRVHMEYIGHPVIGDPLYGTNNRGLYDKGQLLHAYRLTFEHPRTKKEVSFEAPLPNYFKEILSKLS